jgi:hypothetical protein
MPQITFTDPEAASAVELWSDRPEAKALAGLLMPDERLAFMGSGMLGAVSVRKRLIVLTDQRLLVLIGTKPVTRRLIEIPRGTVRSVRHQKGLLKSHVIVNTGQGKVRIYNMSKTSARELFDALSEPMTPRESLRNRNPLTWGHAAVVAPDEPPAILPIAPVSRTIASVGHSTQPSAMEVRIQRLESLTESLESEVTQLREQVAFLEELLQARASN